MVGALVCLVGCGAHVGLPRSGVVKRWPAPPAPTRLSALGSFSNGADLGLGGSWWSWIAGDTDRDLLRPYALATFGADATTGPGGDRPGPRLLAVADTGARVVHLFDLSGADYARLEGPPGRPLVAPVGVAFDAQGGLYVADSARHRVLHWGPDRRYEGAVGPAVERLTGVAVDPKRGRLYVADSGAHQVLVAPLTGGGPVRALPGRFHYPAHLAVGPEGRVVVADTLNFRVRVFDADGRPLGDVGHLGDGSGDMLRPKGVGLDRDGHLYVVDALFGALQIFDMSGHLLLRIGGTGEGPLSLPAGLATAVDDLLLLADPYNGRVVVLRYHSSLETP